MGLVRMMALRTLAKVARITAPGMAVRGGGNLHPIEMDEQDADEHLS